MTSGSSVYPRLPFIRPSAYSVMLALTLARAMHVERVFAVGIEMLEVCWGQMDEIFLPHRVASV
jgi:hypothetical protein